MAGLVRPSIRRELKRVDEGHHVPDGRYMSILLVDNGHYSPEVFYDAGVHELPKDTKYLGVFVRAQLFQSGRSSRNRSRQHAAGSGYRRRKEHRFRFRPWERGRRMAAAPAVPADGIGIDPVAEPCLAATESLRIGLRDAKSSHNSKFVVFIRNGRISASAVGCRRKMDRPPARIPFATRRAKRKITPEIFYLNRP